MRKKYPHPKAVTGISRVLSQWQMRLAVVFFYLKQWLHRKRSFPETIRVLLRLKEFSARQKRAKYMRMGGGVRMGLYVPTYPSKAFYRSTQNMLGELNTARCVTTVISITSSCPFDCEYCYQKLNRGEDTPMDVLLRAIRQMQNDGTTIFVIEGGEPFAKYDRLRAVCDAIDDRSEMWINTTGAGLTEERLLELLDLGVTAFKLSVHDVTKEGHNRFLKSDHAWDFATSAAALFQKHNVPFCFNSYMAKECYLSGQFDKVMALAKEWGAAYIQCLTPRSSGANIKERPFSYTEEDLDAMAALVIAYNQDPKLAGFPSIFFDEFEERRIFGCTAGAGRLYLSAQGELQPCHAVNISIGNIKDKDYSTLREELETMFRVPGKYTACTLLTPYVARHFAQTNVLPIPMERIRPELLADPKFHMKVPRK